jgi:hypothetical protein
MTTTSVTALLSGGGGNQYYIAVGSSTGGSNATTNWKLASNDSEITGISPGFTPGTSYYISAYASNSTLGTSSIAVSNTTAYGITAAPTVTLTITKWNVWSISWTAPSGIAPTSGYTWTIYRTTGGAVAATGTTAQGTLTFSGTTDLLPNYAYTASVYGMRPEGSGATGYSSSVNCPLLAPTKLQYTLQNPGALTDPVSFTLSWTAPGGTITGYKVYINDTNPVDIASNQTYYNFSRANTGSWNQFFRLNVYAVANGNVGAKSADSYHAVWTAAGTTYVSLPMYSKWRFSMSGAGGRNGNNGPGGSGTGVKALLNSKYSGTQTMYIAQNGRGAHGGIGGTDGGGYAGDGGDMTYIQNGYGLYAGGGGGGGGGAGYAGAGCGAGGSCGGIGGGASQGSYWNISDDQTYAYISYSQGGWSGDYGGGGANPDDGIFSYDDQGVNYFYQITALAGYNANGSIGGTGRSWSTSGGGGGGGAVGGGGGATAFANYAGTYYRISTGGGAGSSSASSHFTEYTTQCGSPANQGGYMYMGTYDDGT